jgi:ABC-type polysaccharide transport system permease subunit
MITEQYAIIKRADLPDMIEFDFFKDSSFVYRKGWLEFGWSYSAAVGIFNSVLNLILLITANYVSRKVNNSSLW